MRVLLYFLSFSVFAAPVEPVVYKGTCMVDVSDGPKGFIVLKTVSLDLVKNQKKEIYRRGDVSYVAEISAGDADAHPVYGLSLSLKSIRTGEEIAESVTAWYQDADAAPEAVVTGRNKTGVAGFKLTSILCFH